MTIVKFRQNPTIQVRLSRPSASEKIRRCSAANGSLVKVQWSPSITSLATFTSRTESVCSLTKPWRNSGPESHCSLKEQIRKPNSVFGTNAMENVFGREPSNLLGLRPGLLNRYVVIKKLQCCGGAGRFLDIVGCPQRS